MEALDSNAAKLNGNSAKLWGGELHNGGKWKKNRGEFVV